jgi:hypothetical protein
MLEQDALIYRSCRNKIVRSHNIGLHGLLLLLKNLGGLESLV